MTITTKTHTMNLSPTIRKGTMAKTVIVFSQAGCPPCQRVKEYLQSKKVAFTVKDIGEKKENLKELVETYHSQSTPTTIINGQVVIGFHKDRIDKLLEK